MIFDCIQELDRNVTSSGVPTVRPLWWELTDDTAAVGVNTQFMLGPDYLVAPVITLWWSRTPLPGLCVLQTTKMPLFTSFERFWPSLHEQSPPQHVLEISTGISERLRVVTGVLSWG